MGRCFGRCNSRTIAVSPFAASVAFGRVLSRLVPHLRHTRAPLRHTRACRGYLAEPSTDVGIAHLGPLAKIVNGRRPLLVVRAPPFRRSAPFLCHSRPRAGICPAQPQAHLPPLTSALRIRRSRLDREPKPNAVRSTSVSELPANARSQGGSVRRAAGNRRMGPKSSLGRRI